MSDIMFFFIMASAAVFVFGLAAFLFELLRFIIYRLTGGRMGLITYFKKI